MNGWEIQQHAIVESRMSFDHNLDGAVCHALIELSDDHRCHPSCEDDFDLFSVNVTAGEAPRFRWQGAA